MRAAITDRPSQAERVKALTDRLEQGVKDLFESGRYAAYLNAMSKFHSYSFGYVAGWSRGRELEELRASLECIRATAAELIDGIESRCPELFPKQPQRESKNRKPSLER